MRYVKLLMAFGLASAFIPAAMAQSSTNAESCLNTTWGYLRAIGYEYGAINNCAYPLAVWFKRRNGPMLQKTVEPGQTFRTGLAIDKFEAERRKTGWVAAVCRGDEAPDRAVSDSSWDAILNGKYECRKQ
jgi:hypothetical protein